MPERAAKARKRESALRPIPLRCQTRGANAVPAAELLDGDRIRFGESEGAALDATGNHSLLFPPSGYTDSSRAP
jgi:hypothetical protein